MAITLESNIANSWDSGKEDPETLAYDSGLGGTDRCLFVGVVTEADSVVGVTYNGVPMVEEISITSASGFRPATLQIFSLVNPATGINTVSVDNVVSGADQTIFAVCYNGVNQTTPVGAAVSRTSEESTTGEKTTTLTTTVADSRLLTLASFDGGTSEAELGPVTGFSEITGDSENPGQPTNDERGFVTGMYDREAASVASYTVGQNYQYVGTKFTVDAHIEILAAGGAASDDLLADDIQSTSQTSSPAIGQTHDLSPVGTESTSAVSEPAISQTHDLTPASVQSASELTQPALDSASTVDSLSAEDISSNSEVTAPAIGQVHNIAANDADSDSETGSPSITQEHALESVSLESLSQVSSPSLTEVAGTDNLAANDVESQGATGSPTLAQVHSLTAQDSEAASSTSAPTISQVHQLSPTSIASTTEVTNPVIRDASQTLATPIKNTKATIVQTTYKAVIIQKDYKAEVA